jgi:2-deoxy-D-gluconate 3-dehydrogenase
MAHQLSGSSHRALKRIAAIGLACDVTKEDEVEEAFARIVKGLGALDILVNNAGRAIRKPATELPLAEWEQMIDLNLTGLFCARESPRGT